MFVEEPSSEAFAPIAAAIWRTALLLVAFLLLAVATSVLLARRLVRPIESIQVAAARIGSGALDQRIRVTSHDELGALADEFNRMAERLEASYADLERKVQERTRELATALRELDEKSRELEATSLHKSEFLANMSHELRTPLNAIIGFSQVLRERLFGDLNEKQAEYVDDVLASGHHLLSLINDVLDLSKVEAGQVELDVAPFSLREALESGVVMVRERAVDDGIRVTLASVPEIDVVAGDERRIRQVIFNLLTNAVKFTPEGGTVDVTATRHNGEVQVAVADTGPGIAARGSGANLRGVPADRRGDRAGRGHRPRARPLEAARRAARRPDLGRRQAWQREHVHLHPARGEGVAMAGERILVVEDNEKNMRLFRDVLEAKGYRVIEATGGVTAIEMASEQLPDLVLMDIQLPDVDGIEALRLLRADDRTATIPVIALTAQAMHGDRERFLAVGFDDYVSKPVDIADLARTVERHRSGRVA